jgi:hypothetical protein
MTIRRGEEPFSMRYLLPCRACGEKHGIDTRQAGQRITCVCGAVLDVPALRVLRELDPAAETAAVTPQRSWNPVRGTLFSMGAILVVGGLLLGAYGLFLRLQVDTSEPPAPDFTEAYTQLERLGPDETYQLWQEIRRSDLGPYVMPRHYVARVVAGRCRTLMIAGGILVLVGIGLGAGAMWSRATPARADTAL